MSDLLHRFLWGYGADGYCVLARSAGLSSELSYEARALFEHYDLSEQRPALMSGTLDGFLVLCSVQLRIQPGQRGYWERAFVLVPMQRADVELDGLLALLPEPTQRGELPTPPWPPQQVPHRMLERGEEDAVAALWTAALRGQTVRLVGFSFEEELRVCGALWSRLLPESRHGLHLALGLARSPAAHLPSGICSVEEPIGTEDVVVSRNALAECSESPDLLRAFYTQHIWPLVVLADTSGHDRPWWQRWSEEVRVVLPGSATALCQPSVFRSIALADRIASGQPFVGAATDQTVLQDPQGGWRTFTAWLLHRCHQRSSAELFRIARELSRMRLATSDPGVTDGLGAVLLAAEVRAVLASEQAPESLAERLTPESVSGRLTPELKDAMLRAVHAAIWRAVALLLGSLAGRGLARVGRELEAPWPDVPRFEKSAWFRRLFSRTPDPKAVPQTPAELMQSWLDRYAAERGAAGSRDRIISDGGLGSGAGSWLAAELDSERGRVILRSLIRGLVYTAHAARSSEQRAPLLPVIEDLLLGLQAATDRRPLTTYKDEENAHGSHRD